MQRRTQWCMLKEDMQRGRWGIMGRCQKIRLTWKTLAIMAKSTDLLVHMSWIWLAQKHKLRLSTQSAYTAKIDNTYNKSTTKLFLESSIGKRSKAVSASDCRSKELMFKTNNKKNQTPDIYYCTCYCSSLTKCVCEPGQEAWGGKEYSLTWEMEHVVLCTRKPVQPNTGCAPWIPSTRNLKQ